MSQAGAGQYNIFLPEREGVGQNPPGVGRSLVCCNLMAENLLSFSSSCIFI